MAAEGIMTLAPESAPQQMDPAMQQQATDAFFAQDPNEVEQSVDASIAEDPALAQQLEQMLSSMNLTDEVKEALLTVIDTIFENPGEYESIRQELLAIGFPAELLPETMDLEFFSALRFALLRAPTSAPVQKFKDGGPVSLKPVAQFLQEQGRNGDTLLAHINPQEAAMLKRMGGSGTINPVTGLREYGLKKALKSAGRAISSGAKSIGNAVAKVVQPVVNAVKAVAKPILEGTKKLLANPYIRTAAVLAAAVFVGPAVASFVPGVAAGSALATGIGTAITTTGVNLLAGQKPKEALKGGIATGVVAGVGQYGYEQASKLFTPSVPVTPEVGNVGDVGGVGDATKSGANPQTFASKGSQLQQTGTPVPKPPVGSPVATAPKTFGEKLLDVGLDVGKSVATTVGTGLALQALGPKEEPPSPEDLNVGAGGPTGAELLIKDPHKYGVNVGDISSSYANLSPGQITNPFGRAEEINVGSPVEAEPSPGVLPTLPVAQPYTIPTPNFSVPSQTTSNFGMFGQTERPTPEQMADPTSPFYNPFFAQLAMNSSPQQNVQAFKKGGIASVKKPSAQESKARFERQAALIKAANTPKSTKEKTAAKQVQTRINQQVQSSQTALAQEAAKRENAALAAKQAQEAAAQRVKQAQEEAAARVRAEQEAAQRAQAEAAARAAAEQEAARVRAEQEAAQRAQAEQARISEGVNQYRSMFVAGQNPNIQDQAILSALEEDRAANPRSYMTPMQITDLDAQENFQRELARIEEQKRAFDAEQAMLAKEQERQQQLAKAAADFEAYKQSMLAPVSAPTAPTPTAPTPTPTPTPATVAPGGIGSIVEPTTITTSAPSSDLSTPIAPSAPSSDLSTPIAPSTPSYNIPTFSFNVAQTPSFNPFIPSNPVESSSSAVGFAQGGIAAMAPSKFKSGSPVSGVMNFPRKTGPINGPGTATSDSIPAMLSDGEFVFTAKAVRNFGNGSRREGAKKMYQMMKALERKS